MHDHRDPAPSKSLDAMFHDAANRPIACTCGRPGCAWHRPERFCELLLPCGCSLDGSLLRRGLLIWLPLLAQLLHHALPEAAHLAGLLLSLAASCFSISLVLELLPQASPLCLQSMLSGCAPSRRTAVAVMPDLRRLGALRCANVHVQSCSQRQCQSACISRLQPDVKWLPHALCLYALVLPQVTCLQDT